MNPKQLAQQIKENIMNHELTIYHESEVGDPDFWYPANEMEYLLTDQLAGYNLDGFALRTRSKIVKSQVCEALGYPVPKSFKKTQPRFLCQKFDVYTQKSNNLQIWNEEISPSRRYVLIRISEDDIITKIKVVTGDVLAKLDTTGKLTQKYQARYSHAHKEPAVLLSNDTEFINNITQEYNIFDKFTSPTSDPKEDELMPIELIFDKLKNIVGKTIPYIGATQERNRGGHLHKLICEALGYSYFKDNGDFPDVKHQLLEVKLQTSQTIDLGLFLPSDEEPLDIPQLNHQPIHMCDVRYAIFFGDVINNQIIIKHFYLVNGQDFFTYFTQFGGKKINKKLQIPLPATFWNE
ncbi:restriction endonuclease [Lysinibacillus sp. FSL M8-0337]|uniref:restriction endonuclease n=1 Tax=Lysinibacillus TaxID=400634 RepID=UPI000AD62FFA|nr:restriction endonuclease [Lysinibacillus sphaericus]